MASKLLNVLNKMDSGRQDLINSLRAKGLTVEDNIPFNQLTELIDVFELGTNQYQTNPEGISYTADNDPMIWRVPEEWPDIETIFKSQTEDYSTLSATTLLIPIGIFLIEVTNTTPDTTTFKVYGSPTADTDQIATAVSEYGYSRIKTSDDAVYDLYSRGTRSCTHTWDSSKDIVTASGKHYRYFISYLSYETSTSINDHRLLYYDASVYKVVAVISSFYTGNHIHKTGTINPNIDYIKYITPFTPNGYKHNRSSSITVFNAGQGKVKRFEANVNQDIVTCTEFYITATNSIKSNVHINESNIQNCLYYLEMPYYTGCGTNNNNTPPSNRGRSLKYLIIDPTSQRQRTDFIGLAMHPNLEYTNIFENITAWTNAVGADGLGFPLNFKYISFDNLTTMTSDTAHFYYGSFNCISFPKLTHSTGTFRNSTFNKLIFGAMTNFDFSIGGRCHNLFLPNAVEITVSNIIDGLWHNNDGIKYFYAPLVTRCTTTAFTSCYNLAWLTLGNDFKSSLNLANCWALDPLCIRNLINKLADVTDESDTYTLTLGTYNLPKIDETDLATATSKGWVIA